MRGEWEEDVVGVGEGGVGHRTGREGQEGMVKVTRPED